MKTQDVRMSVTKEEERQMERVNNVLMILRIDSFWHDIRLDVKCHCLYPQWFSPEVSDDAGNDPLCLLHHLHARLHCQNGKAAFTFNEYQLAPSPHISSTYWKWWLFITRSLTNATCTPQCTRSPTCSTGPQSGSTQSSTSWPRGSTRLRRKHEQEHFNSDVSQDAVRYLFQGVRAKSGIQTSNQQIPSFNVDALKHCPISHLRLSQREWIKTIVTPSF